MASESWNGGVPNGGTVMPGFIGSWSGTNAAPTSFSVNGVVCTGVPVTISGAFFPAQVSQLMQNASPCRPESRRWGLPRAAQAPPPRT